MSFVRLFVCCLAVVVAVTADCSLTPNQDCYGNDLVQKSAATAEDCCALCAETTGCTAFTHNPWDSSGNDNPTCYLKSACPSTVTCSQCTAGKTGSGPAPPNPGPSSCHNDVVAGALNITYMGSPHTVYVYQTGGTSKGGVSTFGSTIKLQHNARATLGSTCSQSFSADFSFKFPLLGHTLSFTADLSTVSCACNAALYFTHLPAIGSNGKPDATKSGDYYCDANEVSGIYCTEMDSQEANSRAFHVTPHKCNAAQSNGFVPYCDHGGESQSSQSNPGYGPGASTIDTNSPFNVTQQFVESGGQLSSILTTFSQDGGSFQMHHTDESYLSAMTDAMGGMSLIFSLWGDTAQTMSWLDIPPCGSSENCDTNSVAVWSDIKLS